MDNELDYSRAAPRCPVGDADPTCCPEPITSRLAPERRASFPLTEVGAGALGVYVPGGLPSALGAAPAPPLICEYAMKLPSVPWKKNAAIGGAVRTKVVRISPIPPCCMAWLVTPSASAPSSRNLSANAVIQKVPATRITIQASATMENIVPIPLACLLECVMNNDRTISDQANAGSAVGQQQRLTVAQRPLLVRSA